MKRILIKIIELYQRTLSPDTGWFKYKHPAGYCKYSPNCSEYCKQSIKKHGALKGIPRGIYRILRCNPWSKGGADPA